MLGIKLRAKEHSVDFCSLLEVLSRSLRIKNLSPEQHCRVKQSHGCKEKPSIWRVCCAGGRMGKAEGGWYSEEGDR